MTRKHRNPNTPNPEQVEAALAKAAKIGEVMLGDDALKTRLAKKGIPASTSGRKSFGFWQVYSAYSADQIQTLRRSGKVDPLLTDSLEIVTAAPEGILSQAILADPRTRAKAPAGSRETVQRATRLAADFAHNYPTTPAALLSDVAADFTSKLVPLPGLGGTNGAAARAGKSWIRRGQFSNGFRELATEAGRNVTDAPSTAGSRADYVVRNGDYIDPLTVHVASSLSPIEHDNDNSAYRVSNGVVSLYPPLLPVDFNKMLGLPESVIDQRAPRTDHLLTATERDMLGGTAVRYSSH